jgi:hypothetical protein
MKVLVVMVLAIWCGLGSPLVRAQAWTPSSATELKRSIEANQRKFEALTHMRMATNIDAFMGSADTQPHQRSTSTLWRMGDRYKVEYMGTSTYQDKELRVVIDPEQHTIMIAAPADPLSSMGAGLQDSVLTRASHIGKSIQADGTHYRLKFDGALAYDVVEVVFDPAGWLRRIEMHWAHPVNVRHGDPDSPTVRPKVVIALEQPEPVGPGSMSIDPHAIVEMRNGVFVGKGVWKDYSVFDTRVQ